MDFFSKRQPVDVHPYIPELKGLYRRGRITRREFLRNATLLGMSAAAATAFVAESSTTNCCVGRAYGSDGLPACRRAGCRQSASAAAL